VYGLAFESQSCVWFGVCVSVCVLFESRGYAIEEGEAIGFVSSSENTNSRED